MKRNGHQARGAILAAAMRLFAEKGYHATTLQEVAKSMGVTRAALYYYIPNTSNLIKQIMSINKYAGARNIHTKNNIIKMG